jgi:hypothetical protein
MKSFECPMCRKEFRSYLMCYRGETREIPREREVDIDVVCMNCNSRFPQDNYIKMMEQLTNENNDLITDDNHVFQDRYGCKCILCEYCVLTMKKRWMAEVYQNRNRTYLRCRRRRGKIKRRNRVVQENDVLNPLRDDFIYRCLTCKEKETKFRDYLLSNITTGVRQLAVLHGKEW